MTRAPPTSVRVTAKNPTWVTCPTWQIATCPPRKNHRHTSCAGGDLPPDSRDSLVSRPRAQVAICHLTHVTHEHNRRLAHVGLTGLTPREPSEPRPCLPCNGLLGARGAPPPHPPDHFKNARAPRTRACRVPGPQPLNLNVALRLEDALGRRAVDARRRSGPQLPGVRAELRPRR